MNLTRTKKSRAFDVIWVEWDHPTVDLKLDANKGVGMNHARLRCRQTRIVSFRLLTWIGRQAGRQVEFVRR
jgi:hypothetical protein